MENKVFISRVKILLVSAFLIVLFIGCKDDVRTLERMNYEGDELRTDGFYYCLRKNKHAPTQMKVSFFFRNGVYLWGMYFNDTIPAHITKDSILSFERLYSQFFDRWGVYQVSGNQLFQEFECHDGFDPRTHYCLTTSDIMNDTTFVYRDGYSDTIVYHFHKFDYKPDSTFALQWIP